MTRTQKEIVASTSNLNSNDQFTEDKATQAKIILYQNGISKKFLDSEEGAYIIGKVVEDLIDAGGITTFTDKYILAPIRVNHPHREDKANV
jgi:hypothetical protein